MTRIESVNVSAPSRLHFGLLSFGHNNARQYGGLGAMIDQPRTVVTVRRAERLAANGPFQDRAMECAKRVLCYLGHEDERAEIEIHHVPRPHVGLGSGTQLALCVASGIFTLFGESNVNTTEIAVAAGRGERSAIGTHGFECGGLIFEEGKWLDEELGELAARAELPDSWRFMLLIPGGSQGISGKQERDAFDDLPPVPLETTQQLRHIAMEEILPACERADFDAFSNALYRYGHLAGMCFAPQQSGAFATHQTAEAIDVLRASGIRGVGQSSWGPTVFALVEEHDSTEALRLGKSLVRGENSQVLLAAPSNTGAVVNVNL